MSEVAESLDVNVTADPSAADAVATPDVAAEPSTAEGVKAPASPLEAVKAALDATNSEKAEKPDREAPTREADAKGKEPSEAETKNTEESKDFSNEANKRIRTLVSERNAARSEIESYKQSAQAYETIVERVKGTGASAQQVDQAVEMLRAINSDPARAFQMLQPIYQQLEQFVGNRLPSDLQERVDGGYIDEDSAKELARLRNANQFTEQRHQQFQQSVQQSQQEQSLNGLKQAIGKASTDWDSDWKANDPDYQRKMPLVMAEIKAQIAERGGIQSPQEAIAIANKALSNVNEALQGIIPAKREVKTVTGGFSSGNAAPKPRSPLEATRLALGG